jgi:hypothetical protein
VTESARPKVNFSDRLEMDVKHQGNISVFSRMQIREALQCNTRDILEIQYTRMHKYIDTNVQGTI